MEWQSYTTIFGGSIPNLKMMGFAFLMVKYAPEEIAKTITTIATITK